MKDWKTTLAGIVAAAAMGVGSQMPEYKMYTDLATMLAVIVMGFAAKDKTSA